MQQMIASQYEAALSTMRSCIEVCPDDGWDAPVANHAFCQVVFHTLFYCDYYLGEDEASFRKQRFHIENTAFFRDYEELEDRKPVLLYEREAIVGYWDFCMEKTRAVVGGSSEEDLCGSSGFSRYPCSRAELHVLTIRHIQHHAAQLGLRLRLDYGVGIPWFGSGA